MPTKRKSCHSNLSESVLELAFKPRSEIYNYLGLEPLSIKGKCVSLKPDTVAAIHSAEVAVTPTSYQMKLPGIQKSQLLKNKWLIFLTENHKKQFEYQNTIFLETRYVVLNSQNLGGKNITQKR